MQTTTYSRLLDHEREEISIGLASGETQASLACRLHRSPSTISREVRRNSSISGYRAFGAGRKALENAASRRYGKRRLVQEQPLRRYVLFGLRKRWSLEEIVRRMKMAYPQNMSMRISHKANGLIRQYFPKGTEFDKVSTREIKRVQRQLNNRPRAALGFYKSNEKFNELVALNS